MPIADRPIEAVLFDLDGTLIDTIGLILASMRHATLEVLGREYTDKELLHGVGTPLAVQMADFEDGKQDELVAAYRRHNWDVHDELIAEYPGVEETLQGLVAQGIPMGVVTSKSRRVAIRGIELFGMEHFFEVIVCSDDLEAHKPDPGPILHAAEIIAIEPQRCAYVGDSPYDMRAAVAADSIAVAALWGGFSAEDVLEPGPHYALERITQLPQLLGLERERFRVKGSAAPTTT